MNDMNCRIYLDSFSGAAADLKKDCRTKENVLAALEQHPRVSTWDMSENPWLCRIIRDMKRKGLIVEDDKEPYPWHRYALTDTGRMAFTSNAMFSGQRPG